jgi:hypothetical protein
MNFKNCPDKLQGYVPFSKNRPTWVVIRVYRTSYQSSNPWSIHTTPESQGFLVVGALLGAKGEHKDLF